jgi:hypothetical protein
MPVEYHLPHISEKGVGLHYSQFWGVMGLQPIGIT